MKIFYLNKTLLFVALFIATFFFVYAQKFTFLPLSVAKYVTIIVTVIALFHWIFITKGNLLIPNKSLILYYFSILLLLCYSSLVISYQTNEFSFLYVIALRLTEFFFGSIGLVYIANRVLKFTFHDLLVHLVLIIAIQALFIWMSFFSPEFHAWTIDILPITGNIDAASITRVRGLANSGGATLSLIQGIGAFIVFFLFYTEKNSFNKTLFFILTLFIASSTIPVGRTGLVGFVVMFVSFIILEAIIHKKILQIIHFMKYFGLGFILLIISYDIFVPFEFRIFLEERIFPYAFELFLNVSTSGNLTTESTEDLKTMLFLPDNIKTFLIGDGFWENGDRNYMDTDSGYLRVIFVVGLIGLLLFYSPLFLIFIVSILNVEKRYKIFLTILYCYMVLIEIKEPFLLKPSTGTFVLIISFFILLNYRAKANQ